MAGKGKIGGGIVLLIIGIILSGVGYSINNQCNTFGGQFGSFIDTQQQQTCMVGSFLLIVGIFMAIIGIVLIIIGAVSKDKIEKQQLIKTEQGNIFCRFCGKSIPSSGDYCPLCGKNLRSHPNQSKVCENCNISLSEDSVYCAGCGGTKLVNKTEQQQINREKIFCRFCGKSIPSFSDYCPICGKNLRSHPNQSKKCGDCNITLSEDSEYCANCGTKL